MAGALTGMKKYFIRALLMAVAFGAFAALVKQPFLIEVVTFVFIFSIYSLSWSLMANSGQISLGHAVFFGSGAYASTLMARNLGLPPPVAILVGPLVAALIGLGIGRLCIGLREWFLGMVTFGFSIIAQLIVVEHLGWLTKGWDGIPVPRLLPEEIPLEAAPT
ncbi:MAG TPA: branched-chain amino acid ABC transporter permease, partial [Candidatus Caldiarchaeum subterraneum]|nr:branched-chain amino acid ABC transporter permease [Candidatus Caldarchaeum subterraneum]